MVFFLLFINPKSSLAQPAAPRALKLTHLLNLGQAIRAPCGSVGCLTFLQEAQPWKLAKRRTVLGDDQWEALWSVPGTGRNPVTLWSHVTPTGLKSGRFTREPSSPNVICHRKGGRECTNSCGALFAILPPRVWRDCAEASDSSGGFCRPDECSSLETAQ